MIAGVGEEMSLECSRAERVSSPRLKWRCPGQPHLGTRVDNYRCSLPGLAEFTSIYCERTKVAGAVYWISLPGAPKSRDDADAVSHSVARTSHQGRSRDSQRPLIRHLTWDAYGLRASPTLRPVRKQINWTRLRRRFESTFDLPEI